MEKKEIKKTKKTGINYEKLKMEFFNMKEDKTLDKFLKDKGITTYAKNSIAGWVKGRKEYQNSIMKEAVDGVKDEVKEELTVKIEELMKSKVEIFDILIKRVKDIKGLREVGLLDNEETGGYYDTFSEHKLTSELKDILTMIRTEAGEVNEIKKVEGNVGGFNIVFYEDTNDTDK